MGWGLDGWTDRLTGLFPLFKVGPISPLLIRSQSRHDNMILFHMARQDRERVCVIFSPVPV